MTDKPNPIHNLADTYAKVMVESLFNVTMLIGLYKGSERGDHLSAAAEWLPGLERNLAALKQELSK